MSAISKWFSDNKVVLLGLLGAVGLVLQQYVGETTVDYKVLGFAVALGILSFLAKNLRGQWASIIGILGTAVGTIATTIQSGNKVTWVQLILSIIVAVIAIVAPPAKSLSYETSPNIKAAKEEAAAYDASKVPPVNPPVEAEKPKV